MVNIFKFRGILFLLTTITAIVTHAVYFLNIFKIIHMYLGVVTARAVSVSGRLRTDVPRTRRVHSNACTEAAIQRATIS